MKLLLLFGCICLISSSMADKDKLMSQMNNNFGKNLFRYASKDDGNLLVSPFSAHMALSMLYQGAGGETTTNMADTLHFPDAKTAATEHHKIINTLQQVRDVDLNVANKIYVNTGVTLKPDYLKIVQGQYLSEADEINFADNQGSAKTINTWVENKTNNKIHDLINPDNLGADTTCVLVNAIYFKGNWTNQFDPKNTYKETFYLLNGEEIQVDMMHINETFGYREDAELGCKVLQLPFGGMDVVMLVFLPNERNGVMQLQEKLYNTNVSDVLHKMSPVKVNVALPKFKIESTLELTTVLKEMGATRIFNGADFSKMADGNLAVSDVVQKTFIEINEEGGEAAGATAIMTTRRLPMALPFNDFVADHPFLIGLAHRKHRTYTFLFAGRVSHP